jgi:hypothetical protein
LVLQPGQFTPIDISGSNPQLGEKITGLSSSKKLISNNSSVLENLLTLSSSNLSVLRSVNVPEGEDAVFDSTTVTAVDGSVEPAGGFVYFLAASGDRPLTIFDIQQYNADPDATLSSFIATFPILASKDPDETERKTFAAGVFVTWVKSAITAVP